MITETPFSNLFRLWLLSTLLLASCTTPTPEDHEKTSPFVTVNQQHLMLNGKEYHYLGTNMWYAAYLGSTNPDYGNRERLKKELDQLQANGITNVRILGASEISPLKNSMGPGISERGEVVNSDIIEGLDFALAEMAKRDIKAVIYLNNFWEWSGGMSTYLSWVNGSNYIDMGDPEHPWPAFSQFSSQFYKNEDAKDLYYQYINTLLTRRNSITGKPYRDDPTIMAWQLANEPRPGEGDQGKANLHAYYAWIKHTTTLIKSLAPNHLVSLGSEGTMGCLNSEECVAGAYKNTGIDYMTFHLWITNWSWFDPKNAEATFPAAKEKATRYINEHIQLAERLNMPLVLEEFGVDRDGVTYTPASSTDYRDRLYKTIYQIQLKNTQTNGPLIGTNFWAWGGLGGAQHTDFKWHNGDKSFVGDPPHEPQGWYSVFASDKSTLDIIKEYGAAIRAEQTN